MNDVVLSCQGLCKSFGGLVATDNVSLDVQRGEVHALIGPNGSGKTTVLLQICGNLASDAGRVIIEEHDVTSLAVHRRAMLGLARSFQIESVFDGMSVLSNVMLSVQAKKGHLFRFWRTFSTDDELIAPAERILEKVGLSGRAAVRADALSHGERRQLDVAMALAGDPVLLLLDEPMAGMSMTESTKMLSLLKDLRPGMGMLLVEHDMDMVFALADRVSVLVDGKLIATGTVGQIRASAAVRSAYLGGDG